MIHNRQDSSSIIGGQFAGGKLYLVRANGETVVVAPGQTINDVNTDLMVLKKHQTTSEVVSGSITGGQLTLVMDSGENITIDGSAPTISLTGMVGQSLVPEQVEGSVIGGSIEGSVITLFLKGGDTITINGYTDEGYPDGPGFDVVTTTTTQAPTTTTTTTEESVEYVTTTTTYLNQPPNTYSEANIGYVNGVSTYLFNQEQNLQNMYCQIIEWLVMDADTNSAGSAKRYFGDFKVGTMTYTWQNQPMVNVSGYRFVNLPVYGLSIIELVEGVVQSITRIGTKHYYNGPNGELSQGEVYTDNELYGNCP